MKIPPCPACGATAWTALETNYRNFVLVDGRWTLVSDGAEGEGDWLYTCDSCRSEIDSGEELDALEKLPLAIAGTA